ncbi:MAG: geranylgeranyl reductase family protein [Desulfobacteraceae bacterium]|nr:geranylgeranyl reductase family protein [Desulfobacteraceae bacterium]
MNSAHSNSKGFDCVIVGCGPAGGYLGYLISSLGLKCLILEKRVAPRYKPCGGGLTRRAMDLLPFSLDGVIEDMALKAEVGFGEGVEAATVTDHPMIGLVMRDKFDSFLAGKAASAGATILDDTVFETATAAHGGGLDIHTSKGVFKTLMLAGADGVNSRVAKALGLWKNRVGCPAIEAEVYPSSDELLERYRGSVHFDFGAAPKGYGWVFPKADHLSVGVFSTDRKANGLKNALVRYLSLKGLDSSRAKGPRGHMIPLGPRGGPFATKNGLLIGDAAGLADPITGEGIYHALRQAEIAARCISDAIKGPKGDLSTYNRLIDKEFNGELKYARRLGFLLYGLPRLSRALIRRGGERVLACHLDIITGRSSYKKIFFKAINPGNLLPFI